MKTNSDTPEIMTPKGYNDAVSSPEAKHWKDAMDYELTKLSEMNTWDEMNESNVPLNMQVLPGMWVHMIKKQETGDLKFWSRWVVRGDKQRMNVSLSNTFALVSRISSLWVLLALAMLRDLHIFAWDVDSAYLHGKMDHDLYINLPDGYGDLGRVSKLKKALYGLPKAARIWRKDLEEKLKSLGFSLLESDPGVFLHKSSKGITAIDTHVNDGTGIFSSEEEETNLKAGIQKFYKLKEKDTSKPFKVLGMLVARNTHNSTLKLSQLEYIDAMLQKFELADCQGLSNPTPAYRPTQIYRPSLGNHRPIRPELRSSSQSQFPIHTLRAFIQTLLGQVHLSSYIVPLTQ